MRVWLCPHWKTSRKRRIKVAKLPTSYPKFKYHLYVPLTFVVEYGMLFEESKVSILELKMMIRLIKIQIGISYIELYGQISITVNRFRSSKRYMFFQFSIIVRVSLSLNITWADNCFFLQLKISKKEMYVT